MTVDNPTKWLSITQLTEELEIHRNTAWKMVQTGEIVAYRIRGSWKIKRDDFDAYLEQHRNQLAPKSVAA